MNCDLCKSPIPDESRFCLSCGTPVPDSKRSGASRLSDAGVAAMVELLREDTRGEFEIEHEIGRGGMAAVYLAREVQLGRRVAIKVLPPEHMYGRDAAQRFLREAQTAASLDHPNVIPVYRISSAGRLFWFSMKYLEGRTLAQVMDEYDRMPLSEVTRYLRPVAEALDYAHTRGVVHRDVKPSNVIVDAHGKVIVTDFGVAKQVSASSLTTVGAFIGTPAYVAPEQAVGKEVTGAADQYATGIIAYEMLCGRLPFQADTMMEMLDKHRFVMPVPVSTLVPTLPLSVSAAIERAIAKDPSDRFPSVCAFVERLEAAPVRQRPAPDLSATVKAVEPAPPPPRPTPLPPPPKPAPQPPVAERPAPPAPAPAPAPPAAPPAAPPKPRASTPHPRTPRPAASRAKQAQEESLLAKLLEDRGLVAIVVVGAAVAAFVLFKLFGGPRTNAASPKPPVAAAPSGRGTKADAPSKAAATSARDNSGAWRIRGRMTTLTDWKDFAHAIAPSSTSVVYVARDRMGLFVSHDGGGTWKYSGLADQYTGFSAIAVSPSDPNTLLLAVKGPENSTSDNRGVLRSTDGGTVWRRVLYVNPDLGATAVTFGAAGFVTATLTSSSAGSTLLYTSRDMGASWNTDSPGKAATQTKSGDSASARSSAAPATPPASTPPPQCAEATASTIRVGGDAHAELGDEACRGGRAGAPTEYNYWKIEVTQTVKVAIRLDPIGFVSSLSLSSDRNPQVNQTVNGRARPQNGTQIVTTLSPGTYRVRVASIPLGAKGEYYLTVAVAP